jgi:Arm DNA-binding domain
MIETPRKLTDVALRKYKPHASKIRIISDPATESLYFIVYQSGKKAWAMRFRRLGGRAGKMILGRFDASGHELKDDPEVGQPLSLKAARALAATIHRRRARGEDVIGEHKARRHRQRTEIAERAAGTFGALARRFVAEHSKVKTRRWRDSARLLGLIYSKDGGEPTETKGGLAQRWADKPVFHRRSQRLVCRRGGARQRRSRHHGAK